MKILKKISLIQVSIKIKNVIVPLLLLLSACANQSEKKHPNADDNTEKTKSAGMTGFSWSGTINNKIPVFLHYAFHEGIIAGEITYLNTKDKKPLRVLGTIEEDKSCRILEFEANGNITGIITGTPGKDIFDGHWFSPKTRKEFSLSLSKKDTIVKTTGFQADLNSIYGDYHYQYSEDGYTGDFQINKLDDNKASFTIFSLTGAPGHNIAEVPADTVQITGSSFIYHIPGTDSCEFKVSFYKGFLTIRYTKGYCDGQFGFNATIDGIFLKVKK